MNKIYKAVKRMATMKIVIYKILLEGLMCLGGEVIGQTITINLTSAGGATNIGTNNYNSGAERTWTQNAVTFGGKAITAATGSNSGAIQAQADNGVIYNTTPLPGRLLSVTITSWTGSTNRVSTLYVGVLGDGRLVNNTTANYDIAGTATNLGESTPGTWTGIGSNYRYFAVKRSSSAAYWEQIVITYESTTNYYWNGSKTTPLNGTWNNADNNWTSPTATATPNTVWPASGTTNVANFLTGGGNVSLPGAISSVPSNTNVGTNFTFTSSVASSLASPIAISSGAVLSLDATGTGSITLSDIISGAGGLSFNGSSSGSFTLTGANTFTGNKTLNNGTLNIGHATALGDVSGSLIINGGAINTSGGALTTPNYPQSWNGDFTFVGTNNLNLGAGAVTITNPSTVTVSSNTLTIAGSISSTTNTLTKAGLGTLALNAYNNGLTGGINLNAGSLLLGGTNALGTGLVNFNGGTLRTGASTGYNQSTDNLLLSASSTLELGSGNHSIQFAGSAGSWNGAAILTISGWTGTPGGPSDLTSGKVFVMSSLSTSELDQINFAGFGPGAVQLPSGEIVPRVVVLDFVNLQFPATATITVGGTMTAYAQVYEPGLTPGSGQAPNITAWIGYSSTDDHPSNAGWTWIPAIYNPFVTGNNDEYMATFGASLIPGTYYYASRFLISGGLYQYGGYSGGEWDGISNVSGVLTVNDNTVDFANLQTPARGSILQGEEFYVYAQVQEPGITEIPGAPSNLTAWIGYNTNNANPWDAGWTWVPASWNVQVGNNDEFRVELGTSMLTAGPGRYYYASRFQIGSGSYSYGGINSSGANGGNFWNGTTYISGVLDVADIKGNSVAIPYGSTSPSTTNFTAFGNACVGTPVVRTFTIQNNSTTTNIDLGALSVSPATDFTISSGPGTTISPGATASFDITFNPASAGAKSATMSFVTDLRTYSFAVSGTGLLATTVTTQPTNQSVASLSTATFTVAGAGQGAVTYQWQIFSAGSWINVPTGAPYSGETTGTLTINPASLGMNGNQYRCVISADCGSVNSNVATLTVTAGAIWMNPIIGADPGLANPFLFGQIFDPNISVSGIGRSGVNGNSATNRYNTSNWSTGAIDLNKYFEFTLTPLPGYQINFSSFVYSGQTSSGTPTLSIRSSLDGYASDIGAPVAGGSTLDLTNSLYQEIGCPITFRIYVYYIATAGTTYSINDFTFNGTVTTPVTSKLTITNGGTPAAGIINIGTTNVVLSAFNIIANASQTFSSVSLTKTGTTTTADLNNLRIFWDQNANGIIDGADASVSGAGIPLAASMNFTLSGQTFGCPSRRYMVVADVLPGATMGNTVTTSIANATDVSSTITNRVGNALGNQQTIGFVSLATDYFRSNVATGNWNVATSWQSSRDNVNYYTASLAPTSSATAITILSGNIISINSSGVSMTNTEVFGTLRIATTSSFNVSGPDEIELTIKNGGLFLVESAPSGSHVSGNAFGLVETGGKIMAGSGITPSNIDGTDFMADYVESTFGLFYFDDGAICEWNSPDTYPGSTGATNIFAPLDAGDMPIFRMTAIQPTYNYGGGGNIMMNAILELNTATSFKLTGNTTKTIVGGVRSINTNGHLDRGTSTGTVFFGNGTNIPVMSSTTGNSLRLTMASAQLRLDNGANVPSPSNVVIQSTAESNSINRNGGILNIATGATLDITNMRITNTALGSVTVDGTLRTAHSGGLYSTGSAITSGSLVINTGSTIEYYATVNQAISNPSLAGITGTSTVSELPGPVVSQAYYNVIFSGSGTKTPQNYTRVHTNGSVRITGTPVVNFTGFNLGITSANSTSFTMDGGRLILGTGNTQPNMEGLYNLTAGVVEFAANSGNQTIRGTANNAYQNIEVTGINVSNGAGNVNLNANGTFTIKPTGVLQFTSSAIVGPTGSQTFTMEAGSNFMVANEYGFHGPDNSPSIPYYTASVQLNVENINLQPGSTINYNRQAPLVAATQTITTTVPYQHLILSGENVKTPVAGSTVEIKGNLTKSGTSSFAHNEGTVLFSGSTAQNYTVNAGSSIMDFNNVTNNNTIGLNINSDAGINQKLSLSNNAKLNLLDTADIILRSKLDTTAWVGIVPTTAQINYNASGRFVIERRVQYVGNWNMLASPTAEAQLITASWQNGHLYEPNFGTRITGPGGNMATNGLDGSSVGYSMKWWNPLTGQFNMTQFTNSTLSDSLVNRWTGYFLFVRGDRNTPNGSVGSPTVLRSRGKLFIGNSTEPIATRVKDVLYTTVQNLPANSFIQVGNPFASAIDFTLLGRTNIKNAFYVWDPELLGNYGVGQYRTMSFTNGWIPTPTSGPNPNTIYPNTAYSEIQSGQAFMVESDIASLETKLTFSEAAKTDGNRLLTRNPQNLVMMSTMLHNHNKLVADGNRLVYDTQYHNNFGAEDAVKILNGGENFGIITEGKNLIIEGRKPIVETDTIFYQMSNLRTQAYKLSFEPLNLNTNGLIAELIDGYLHTRTPVSLTDSTWYSFSTNADAASKAANRFMLVFRSPGGPVPVTFVSIAAQRQTDRSIKVNWEVANEINIEKYEVQRSADGQNFTGILQSDATNSRLYTKTDLSPLAADNFYRIKAIGLAGDITYSPIVKVAPEKQASLITVQPNPVKDKQVNIRFNNQPAGEYALQLTNTLGQVLFAGTVTVANNAQVNRIQLSPAVTAGNYLLTIKNKTNQKEFSEMIVIE